MQGQDPSGLTEDVAKHLGYFILAVNRGAFDDAAVHDRLARCAFFSNVASQLSAAVSAVRLCASRALKEPAWTPETDLAGGGG
jgi:hypothetical protein